MNWFHALLLCLMIQVSTFAAHDILYSCEQLKDSTNHSYSVELVEKDFHEFVVKLKDETTGTLSEIEMSEDSKYDAVCKKFLNKNLNTLRT